MILNGVLLVEIWKEVPGLPLKGHSKITSGDDISRRGIRGILFQKQEINSKMKENMTIMREGDGCGLAGR